MPGLRERNKADKAARIGAAAAALFAEKGFEATTIRDIAARAGVGLGTVFLHVRSKEELVAWIFYAPVNALVDARLASLPRRATPVTQLLHVFGALLEHFAAHRDLAWVLIREMTFFRGADRARRNAATAAFVARLVALFERWRDAGLVRRDVDLALAARTCFGLHFLHVIRAVTEETPPRALVRDLRRGLELLFTGLRSSKGASR